jgi:hypothetical protein
VNTKTAAPNATADKRPKDNFDLLMTRDQLEKECPFLFKALTTGFKFGVGGPDFEHLPVTKLDGRYEVQLYTKERVYCITVRPPTTENDRGYVGCTSSARMPLAGESWTRGSDLADGNFSMETWNDIMTDIVSNEIVKLESQKDFEDMHKFAAERRENLLTVAGEKT